MLDGMTIGIALIIGGALLLALEAATPGFFVGAIGTALLLMGLIALAVGDAILTTVWAPIIMVVVATIGMGGSVMLYRRFGEIQPPTTTVATSLIGKKGIVTRETDPDHDTRGKVKIGSTVWSATSDRVLEEGTRVEVVEAEGVHVKVRAIQAPRSGR